MKRIITLLFILGFFFLSTHHSLAEDTVSQLKERIIDIQNKGKLGIRNFTLCSKIIGYAQYTPLSSNKVKAGREIHFYYEPVNLYTERSKGTYHIWYTQDVILTTQDGKEIYRAEEILNFNYRTKAPVLDIFATNSINLGHLPPGVYNFKVIVHDKLRKEDTSHTYKFEIIP